MVLSTRNYLVKTFLLVSTIWLASCGSRKVHIEEYKSGAVVSKMEVTKSENQSETKTEKLTNIVQNKETNDFEIIADEIIIKDNQGNTATLKNAVISNKKRKSDTNVVKSEKVEETSQTKAIRETNEVSKVEQEEKVRDTDRKQFNWTKPIILLVIILVSIYFIRRNLFS